MSAPLSITFGALAKSANAHALDVLIAALDVPDDAIHIHAIKALLNRRNSRGHVEIINRLHLLPPELHELLDQHVNEMAKGIRQCLLSDDSQQQQNGLTLIREFKLYDLLPALLALLGDQNHEHQKYCLDTVNELVSELYELSHPTEQAKSPLRKIEMTCANAVTTLERACVRSDLYGYERIVENLFILGDVKSEGIRNLLQQHEQADNHFVVQLLLTSKHPGVMQLVVELMGQDIANQIALRCLSRRDDEEFILHLLQHWPRTLSRAQQKNTKLVETVGWLEKQPLEVGFLPDSLHTKMLQFASATDIRRESKLRVAEWVLRNGHGEALRMATGMLNEVDGKRLKTLVTDGLESQDEEVQAWATSQLRSQKVPEAFTKLIERLDSPLTQVQQVAREELEDFNLNRVLTLFDLLEPETCRRVGQLILKIDTDTISKLQVELSNPMRSKRIRAAQAAYALDLHEQVLDCLIVMLEDTDMLARRTALDIIIQIPGDRAAEALKSLLNDPNARIREVAIRSLQQRGIQCDRGERSTLEGHPVADTGTSDASY